MGSHGFSARAVLGAALGLALGLALAAPAGAQSLRTAGPPAEFPPESYTGNQYVDSRGCVYSRAGIGGATTWVPRVNRQRDILCGFQPTFADPPEPAAAPVAAETAPNPLDTAVAPRPAPAAAPAPAAPEARAAPPRPALTRAEVCEGRYGIQPGFVSSGTGAPVDCGPRPVPVAAAAAPPVPAGPPAPGVRRATRDEICAEIRATGRGFLDVATGLPVRCPTDPAALAGLPVAVPAAAAAAAPVRTAGWRNPFNPPIPASNPVAPPRVDPPPPRGYVRVWTDGRLNPHRGLRRPAAAGARVSSRSVAEFLARR